MRTIKEIKNSITTQFMGNEYLQAIYGFNASNTFEAEFSLLSLENILFDIISVTIFVLENLFDKHQNEVSKHIYEQKIGSLRWYRNKALDYQYGFGLIPDTDRFANGNATEDQINASKIITYAAVTEADDEQRVIVKVANESGTVLQPLEADQEEAFSWYMNEIKFAGTPLTVINYEPDRLFLSIDIYRDPLVLDENGISILNGNVPVEEALKEYVKQLPFNGELTINSLVDALQNVNGVQLVNIINVETSWIDPQTNDYGVPESIDVRKIPESGYFSIIDFNSISYVV